MPIKRLDRGPSLPRLGTLRKGSEKGERKPGKNLTWLRIDTPFPELEEAYYEKFGKEPREIPVFLPFPEVDQNWQAWQEEWVAGGLVHRCDGEVMNLWRDPQTGKMRSDPKACPYYTGEKQRTRKNPGCKPIGRLKVVITDLPRFGYFSLVTTSEYDIIELDGTIKGYYRMSGDLSGIQFILSRRPQSISVPMSDGKRVRKEEWLLHLDVDPAWAQRRLMAARAKTMALPVDLSMEEHDIRVIPQLTGEVVDTGTGEIIDSPDEPDETSSHSAVAASPMEETDKEKVERKARELWEDSWQNEIAKIISKSTSGKKTKIGQLTPTQLNSLLSWLDEKLADALLERGQTQKPAW